jgi:hypothetical protein
MRNRWCLGLMLLAGCGPLTKLPEDAATPQVASMPFTDPARGVPTRVNYAPASQETSYRVLIVKDKLVGTKSGGLPNVTAIGAAEPEVFHVRQNQIFITEGLVRQCQTEGQLAAVLASEMGRMISEREATVSDEIRQPDRLLPIELKTGSVGSPRDSDPTHYIEMAMYEKNNPKQHKKLVRPNPQLIARNILEQAGYQSTDFDAATPILQNAERNQVLENQFKGTTKQGDWKQPY